MKYGTKGRQKWTSSRCSIASHMHTKAAQVRKENMDEKGEKIHFYWAIEMS